VHPANDRNQVARLGEAVLVRHYRRRTEEADVTWMRRIF
jgi:hypothetical protein